MGFARVWVTWIMACVNSVSFSVLLNGRTHGFIKPERGIRQGDPLSPFLFILVAEAFVGCLNNAESNGKLQGISLAVSGPSVHHLLFADDSLLMCQANVDEATELMNCIKLYGEASGQQINVNKSSIIFGSKVLNHIRIAVKEVLGIEREGGEGTYLGLPECFSGSKRHMLSFIQEKLQGRVNGWFSKTLSTGGKEIMVKSVGLAMPIFAMSCFKLTKKLCEKITSTLIQYWWSNGSNQRKISWVSWQQMCKRKEEGGLGFHEIEGFNQALLGKQAWRVMNNPESLVSRILKSRYFPRSDFLTCSVGTRPSYAWRSILHGRELLSLGLVQAVGSGKNTSVWIDKWLMDGLSQTTKYRQDSVVDLTLKVSDLFMGDSNQWNREALFITFKPEDALFISRMKCYREYDDKLQWGCLKNGQYSTKSGYEVWEIAKEREHPTRPNLPPIEKRLWQQLWKTKAPSKLRHFMWKAMSGALAVKERLVSRGLQVNSSCGACNGSTESICHILFSCPVAKEVWEISGIPLPPSGFSDNSIFLNLHYLIDISKKVHIDQTKRWVFPWILWHLWKSRNALLFENTQFSPTMILEKAFEDATIWLTMKDHIQPNAGVNGVNLPTYKWQKPMVNVLKCNIGASWSSSNNLCGVAWLVRDHTGNTLLHGRRTFSLVHSLREAELLGIWWAAESLATMKFDRIIFEASLEKAREIMLNPSIAPNLQERVSELQGFLDHINLWSLEHTLPSRNQAAMMIATSVTRDHKYQSYIAANGPFWLCHLLNQEAKD